ncbi:MAG: hypothetical protein D6714_05965, partial [Bacteroidetes bacterium]
VVFTGHEAYYFSKKGSRHIVVANKWRKPYLTFKTFKIMKNNVNHQFKKQVCFKMKRKLHFKKSMWLLPWIMLFVSFGTIKAQTGQWSSETNVGTGNLPAGTPLADWLYDIITTANGNYLAVGFAREDETIPSQHDRVPAYCFLATNGVLQKDVVIEGNKGQLENVIEAPNDSYYSAGYRGANALVVRINKATLDYTTYEFPPQIFDYASYNFSNARLKDVIVLDDNGTPKLIVTGSVRDANFIQ